MYRRREGTLQVFLVHPGGPFWASRDLGSWGIPKGEYKEDEAPLAAAQREFQEETGFTATGPFQLLGTRKQPSGKLVTAWACQGDCDPALLKSNTCMVEWPPRSGKRIRIPEVDRGEWFTVSEARERMLPGQLPFLDALKDLPTVEPVC